MPVDVYALCVVSYAVGRRLGVCPYPCLCGSLNQLLTGCKRVCCGALVLCWELMACADGVLVSSVLLSAGPRHCSCPHLTTSPDVTLSPTWAHFFLLLFWHMGQGSFETVHAWSVGPLAPLQVPF